MGYCICRELLAGKMSSCTKLGNFSSPKRESSPWNKRSLSLGIFLFSAYQQQSLEMMVSHMTIICSRMNLAHLLHEDLPNQAHWGWPDGNLYIFFIAYLKSCCPCNCGLCFLSPNTPVENILLILCSNLSIFLLCGLVWKVGIQMELTKYANLFSGCLFYGATLIGQWQLLLQQLKKYRTSLCITTP